MNSERFTRTYVSTCGDLYAAIDLIYATITVCGAFNIDKMFYNRSLACGVDYTCRSAQY